MGSEPVSLAFVWHQHQPNYQDLSIREMLMPWVRLHATKDYYDLPAKLKDYPKIHQTFNLVPSLLRQLKAYETGEVTDPYLRLTEKPPGEMDESERSWLLKRFFDANRHWMIAPYPRYLQLWRLRGSSGDDEAHQRFTEQDLLDLQVWFNLVWFDPLIRENDAFLSDLIRKGRDFNEEDKLQLLQKQREVVAQVIPVHREMAQQGQVELTTTPFYHPILPLLCDSEIARECMPEAELPRRFRHPEDARRQIERGLEYFESVFGFRPQGMWPSEGSVSAEALDLIASAGVRWAATDEEILSLSLGRPMERTAQGDLRPVHGLYQPYRFDTAGGPLALVFRDHFLSDLIGFHYGRAPAREAAKDFVSRVLRAGQQRSFGDPPALISVILDGENCWEYYARDGHDFLDALYERLSESDQIRCVTVSEYLEEHPPATALKRIFPGSWINHNFRIWIGHAEDNRSWDLLSDAREALRQATEAGETPDEDLQRAWEELYIAEGSDWNWWYGDDHTSGQDELFDQLYRRHLTNVYQFIGREIPGALREPIGRAEEILVVEPPRNFISPRIDGKVSAYYEWQGAGFFDPVGRAGAMHRSFRVLEEIYFGFDLECLYFRLGTHPEPADLLSGGHRFEIQIVEPAGFLIRIDQAQSYELMQRTGSQWRSRGRRENASVGRIVECSIPWRVLGCTPGQTLKFFVQIFKDNVAVETCPEQQAVPVDVPDEDFEARMWVV